MHVKRIIQTEHDKVWAMNRIRESRSPVVFELNDYKPLRSISQNALYWLWLSALEKETGNDKNYLHDYFRNRYLGKVNVMGMPLPVSTTNLDSGEFSEYMEHIRMDALDLGIYLPDPENIEPFRKEYGL